MTILLSPKNPSIPTVFLDHCDQKTYPAKQLIIKAGEPSDHLYYVISGSVTVMIEDQKNHEIVLSYLNAGQFFGELGIFNEEENHRSAFVRARTRSCIAKINYDKLKSLPIFPELLYLIASQMASRIRKTTRKVGDLIGIDVKGRVARALLDLCREPDAMTHPDGMQIKVTRQELGRIVGCSREMVGKVLKNIEEEDRLISVSGKTMVIFGKRWSKNVCLSKDPSSS